MTTIKKNRVPPFGQLVLLTLLSAPANADTEPAEPPDAGSIGDPAAEWLETLEACYEKVHSIQADFVQERLSKLGSDPEIMKGVLQARSGGLARLDYTEPYKRAVITDGKTVWAVDKKEKIAFRDDADKSVIFRAVEFILNRDADGFSVSFLGGATKPGRGTAVVGLSPNKTDPFVESIALTLDGACPCVKRVLVVDRAHVVIRLTLSDIKTNIKIGKGRFAFSPGSGVKVVNP